MGVADIVGLAVCWLLVAALLVWGVLTEAHRGGDAPEPRVLPDRPPPRPAATRWVVVESLAGAGPDVRRQGELLVSAALAAHGVDPAGLGPADHRIEVATRPDGAQTTRFLLRPEVLTTAGPR